jgi:hypothetical protein
MMIRMTTALIAACIVMPAATPANAQQRPKEPRSILCQGKAVSPILGPGEADVSLSATIDFDRRLEVVLQDDKGKQELVGRQQVLGTDDLDVYVRTGSLTVQKASAGKVILKMLWQKAGISEDFIGLVITLGYTSVLRVDSHPYETGESTQMPFDFFDGLDAILYRGTCVAG